MSETLKRVQQHADTLPYGVTVNALDGSYVCVNEPFRQTCGYAGDALLDMSFKDITHPEDIAPNVRFDEQLRDGIIPFYQMTKSYVTSDEDSRRVLLQVSLLRDEDQQPRYYYAQVLDVTAHADAIDAQKRVQQELDDLLQLPDDMPSMRCSFDMIHLLQVQEQQQKLLLSAIIRDINDPLNRIGGFTRQMKYCMQKGQDDRVQDLYEKVSRGCKEIVEQIRRLRRR